MTDPVPDAEAFGALYDALATRLDHSDTLYYGQLNACTTINLAIAAGFGALVKSTHVSGIDSILVVCCGVAGLSITKTFNYYMQNEKQY